MGRSETMLIQRMLLCLVPQTDEWIGSNETKEKKENKRWPSQEGGVGTLFPLFCNQWKILKETGMVILQLELANSRLAWSELGKKN